MSGHPQTKYGSLIFWLGMIVVTGTALRRLPRLLFGAVERKGGRKEILAPDIARYPGLSEAEAARRRPTDLLERRELASRQVRRDIWRTSTFSVFNFNMLGLATAQALLGDVLSALLSFAVFLLNVGLNAAQQLYATNRVEKLLDLARPQPTVIRDSRIRSVDLDEIVVGDVLTVGPGDEFLFDGALLSGDPTVVVAQAGESNHRTTVKRKGDPVRVGAYCLEGRAIYQVSALSGDFETPEWTPVPETAEALSPLQRIMARVLRIMLVLIILFLALLVADMLALPIVSTLFEDVFREAASGFFSIAPSSLFFMIVATYALGSARLGELGALVRESRVVESLAQVSVICFSKAGALTGAEVHIETIASRNAKPALSESRIRQLLGDLAHSVKSDNVFLQAIAQNFAGSSRPADETAPHLSAYGWLATTFLEADVRGTYVVGEPRTLEPYFAMESGSTEAAEGEKASEPVMQKGVEHIRQLFKRLRREEGATQRDLGNAVEEAALEEEQERAPQLLFAYLPEPAPLHDANNRAQLPEKLIPLCSLRFEEQVRPEAIAAMQAFTKSGIKVKVLSSDEPESVLDAAVRLGVVEGQSYGRTVVSGPQLAQMGHNRLVQTMQEAAVFAQLTGEQKGQIVRTLRQQGEWVAMVGDAAHDISAMEEANVRITLRSSSQAALRIADIVLLDDSFQVIPTVLDRGQRVVNGMLDILKINLAQIGYVLLLTVVMMLSGRRIFYYHPTQGGVIGFFTILLPSLGLTLWASGGALPRQYMRARLWHFAAPAAVSMTAACLVVSWIFGRGPADVAYSQLAVTYLLVTVGLALVVFVQPPTRFWVGGDVLSRDWRNTYMALVLFLLFIIITMLPLTRALLRLGMLQDARDYAVIGAVAVMWTFLVRATWRAPWLSRYVRILSARLEQG